MEYEIIEDYQYSTEDINELVIKDENENYYYFKNICHLLMIGSTIVSTNDTSAKESIFKTKSFPTIEVLVDSSFGIEEYNHNSFSLEDYKFCNGNLSKRNLTEKILSFKSLQESWDGFGAVPLEIQSSLNAINFINFLYEYESDIERDPIDVFPNPHGTISMIWENLYEERLSLEIGNYSLSYYNILNGSEPEFFNDVELKDDNFENIIRKINSLF